MHSQAEFDRIKQKVQHQRRHPVILPRLPDCAFRLTIDTQSDPLEQKRVCVVSIQVKTNKLSKLGFEINLETNNLISQKV